MAYTEHDKEVCEEFRAKILDAATPGIIAVVALGGATEPAEVALD